MRGRLQRAGRGAQSRARSQHSSDWSLESEASEIELEFSLLNILRSIAQRGHSTAPTALQQRRRISCRQTDERPSIGPTDRRGVRQRSHRSHHTACLARSLDSITSSLRHSPTLQGRAVEWSAHLAVVSSAGQLTPLQLRLIATAVPVLSDVAADSDIRRPVELCRRIAAVASVHSASELS